MTKDKFKIPTTPAEIIWVKGNVPPAIDEQWPEFSVVATWLNGPPPNSPITILLIKEGVVPEEQQQIWVFDSDSLRDSGLSQEEMCNADWWALVGTYDFNVDSER